jgi:hypothetical protein
MFRIDEVEKTIHATRGDAVLFDVVAKDTLGDKNYGFVEGDTIRIKIYKKRNADDVVLEKTFVVDTHSDETKDGSPLDRVQISLSPEDTKKISGDKVISKPTTFWYEIEYKPNTKDTQTIIGYDEDGAKQFILYPEGGEIEGGT